MNTKYASIMNIKLNKGNKMKIVNIVVSSGLTLLLVGCATKGHSINTANHTISLENGKKYIVPVGSSYTKEPVTKGVIKRYTELGVKNCNMGDITWETKSVAEALNNAMREGTKDQGIAIIREAAKEGTIGCASAI